MFSRFSEESNKMAINCDRDAVTLMSGVSMLGHIPVKQCGTFKCLYLMGRVKMLTEKMLCLF